MRIVLYKPTVLATGLSRTEAKAALAAASASPASKYFTFTLLSGPKINGFELQSHPKNLDSDFLDDPSKFTIDI